MAQSPLDLFGQFRFLDPAIFGSSWTQFSQRYAVRGNPRIPQQITGYQNEEELRRLFHRFAFRVGKEVLDLPSRMHVERPVTLGKEARRIYAELEERLIADVAGGVVTVSNALTRLLRLQQVASGYLPEDDTGRVMEFCTAKRDALRDLLTDLGEPAVVFCNFTHDLQQVEAVARELDRSYGQLSGGRNDLTCSATIPPGTDVFGVQIKSGREGVDFTEAASAIYYSQGFSLGDYEQSLDRVHRPGQSRPVTYYHLIAENSVDRRVYRALRERKQVIEAVLAELTPLPQETMRCSATKSA